MQMLRRSPKLCTARHPAWMEDTTVRIVRNESRSISGWDEESVADCQSATDSSSQPDIERDSFRTMRTVVSSIHAGCRAVHNFGERRSICIVIYYTRNRKPLR